jgi:hypothetical protein
LLCLPPDRQCLATRLLLATLLQTARMLVVRMLVVRMLGSASLDPERVKRMVRR